MIKLISIMVLLPLLMLFNSDAFAFEEIDEDTTWTDSTVIIEDVYLISARLTIRNCSILGGDSSSYLWVLGAGGVIDIDSSSFEQTENGLCPAILIDSSANSWCNIRNTSFTGTPVTNNHHATCIWLKRPIEFAIDSCTFTNCYRAITFQYDDTRWQLYDTEDEHDVRGCNFICDNDSTTLGILVDNCGLINIYNNNFEEIDFPIGVTSFGYARIAGNYIEHSYDGDEGGPVGIEIYDHSWVNVERNTIIGFTVGFTDYLYATGRLVLYRTSIDGYSFRSFILASSVVNCQSIFELV